MEFWKPELKDREEMSRLLRINNSGSCDDSFANMYLWQRMYPLEAAYEKGMLVVRSLNADRAFRFPFGPTDHLKEVVEEMMEEAAASGDTFMIGCVTPEQFALLEELFPGKFVISYDRDYADYVYDREKLATLSGKKYHGKKNHVNKFNRLYPDWTYESITDENVEECFQLAMEWRTQNEEEIEEEQEMRAEVAVTMNALRLMKELNLSGGLIRESGRVVAFSIGEPLSDDVFVVHIEKALAEIEGAYTIINQQFVIHETEGFALINREDDTGDDGLRQAKLSYHPVKLIEKGTVTYR